MKKRHLAASFLLITIVLVFFALFVPVLQNRGLKAADGTAWYSAQKGQERKGQQPPPGMEIVKIGQVNFMVPEGARFYKKDGLIILEGIDEYAARRFLDIEERLTALEESVNELNDRLYQINETLKNKWPLSE